MSGKPKLELSLTLTDSEGGVQHIQSSHDFPNDEEAEDMYWSIYMGAGMASNDERMKKRGNSKSAEKAAPKSKR